MSTPLELGVQWHLFSPSILLSKKGGGKAAHRAGTSNGFDAQTW
jgi:hypothetical protein